MNGNLPMIIEDARKLADAVFKVYPQVLANYSSAIGPVSTPEQQKILFDLSVTCLAIANKESRVAAWKEERKNGNGNGHKDSTQHDCDVPLVPGADKTEQGYRQRDTRDRPTEQLIKELNIKSPAQAGWLRANKEISYIEWKRIRDYVSQKEIENGGGFTSP